MTQATLSSKVRLQSGLERYKKYQPTGTKWTREKIVKGYQGEDWTAKSLDRIEKYRGDITVENNIPFGNGNIDHIVTYAGGKILMLDSKNWSGEIEQYFGDVKKQIEKEKKFLEKHDPLPEYAGVIFYGHDIPGGFQKTEYGFYIINPNYLGTFIKEIGEK